MKGDRRATPIGMPELLVGATLANFDETVPHEKRDDLPRLENRDRPHV